MATIVDREKDCPFLLRVFYRNGGHNPTNRFTVDEVPQEELSLYTWKNATLEELSQLIEQVVPEAQDDDARIAFRLIYLDPERARYACRDIGRVVHAKPTADQKKTLDECNFFIGDFLDVAIYIGPPPLSNQRRGGPGGNSGGGRMGGGFNGRDGGGRRDRFDNNNSRFGARQDRRRDLDTPYSRDGGRFGTNSKAPPPQRRGNRF